MSASNLQKPIFIDNDKAREWLEASGLVDWRVCPHCGIVELSRLRSKGESTVLASISAPIAASNSQ